MCSHFPSGDKTYLSFLAASSETILRFINTFMITDEFWHFLIKFALFRFYSHSSLLVTTKIIYLPLWSGIPYSGFPLPLSYRRFVFVFFFFLASVKYDLSCLIPLGMCGRVRVAPFLSQILHNLNSRTYFNQDLVSWIYSLLSVIKDLALASILTPWRFSLKSHVYNHSVIWAYLCQYLTPTNPPPPPSGHFLAVLRGESMISQRGRGHVCL